MRHKIKDLEKLKKIAKIISKSKNIAIFTHIRPDGDALGSSYALKLALQSFGKNAEVFLEQDCKTKEYSLIEKFSKNTRLENFESKKFECKDADLKIALDMNDLNRLGKMKEKFVGLTIVLDHHRIFSKCSSIFYVDPDASSTGEIVYLIIKLMKIKITKAIANNLYIALVSDSGCFKYSCTRSLTHKITSKLIETGIDFSGICKILFDTHSRGYLNIMKITIEKMEFYENGKISFIALKEEDFLECKIDEASSDGMVNLARNIGKVEIGIYVRRLKDCLKVSLRSNSYANVTNIAKNFGGGGHIKAAGFTICEDFYKIKEKLISLAKNEIMTSV